MKERRYDYAEGMYAAAAALDGSKPEALFGRAGAMLATGRHVEVGHILTRAFKDHPDWAKRVPDLKTVYPDSDQWERILGDVKADLEKSPDNAGLHFVAGYVLYAVGQPAAAVPYLEKAAALRGARGPEQVLLDAMKEEQAK
jgi:tetratricopeptide (TPR) repeat protein